MKEDRQEIKDKEEKTLFRDRNRHLSNEFNCSAINERKKGTRSQRDFHLKKGDMAKSVDATDLIGLSLGMETY